MHRRRFFGLGLGASAARLAAFQGEWPPERVESMTPPAAPAIALNHLGFLPESKKILIVRDNGQTVPTTFRLRDIAGPKPPFVESRPLRRYDGGVSRCVVGDFSDIRRQGMYQIAVGDELSVPFFIRPDVWRRTLPKAESYYRQQRCGVNVPNVHPACHLDDARRRDNGRHVDVTGGWHDAGDLRKWISTSLMNVVGLLRLARNLGPAWDLAGAGLDAILDEVRWGNRYLLKMQDADGLVWADTAGGIDGDNSDNHWTDNRIGTADDRYLNTAKSGGNQALFVTAQGMAAREFRSSDAEYARQCRQAAIRCWDASRHEGATGETSWWLLAALEMHHATGEERYSAEAARLAGRLLELQTTEFSGGQKQIRGFWRASEKSRQPYVDAVSSALPPLALLEAANALPGHAAAIRWREAVRMHLEEYVLPMAAHSAYAIMPYGAFFGSPTAETYRPLAGELTYRYFLPVRKQSWWLGTTSHLECYAVLLAEAAGAFHQPVYRDLAFRQLEWIMGANPFGACLMTGEGMRNPYPHSRFVGLIPGGIMNGIAGNREDVPVLDTAYGFDWRTTEYWSPHNAFYLWAVSSLERVTPP